MTQDLQKLIVVLLLPRCKQRRELIVSWLTMTKALNPRKRLQRSIELSAWSSSAGAAAKLWSVQYSINFSRIIDKGYRNFFLPDYFGIFTTREVDFALSSIKPESWMLHFPVLVSQYTWIFVFFL